MTVDYGSVEYDGIVYRIVTHAVADNYGTEGRVVYQAYAVSPEGDEVEVLWEPTKEWLASNAIAQCDWRGIEPDMEEISESFGVPVDFVGCDLNDESYACDWDHPAAVRPSH